MWFSDHVPKRERPEDASEERLRIRFAALAQQKPPLMQQKPPPFRLAYAVVPPALENCAKFTETQALWTDMDWRLVDARGPTTSEPYTAMARFSIGLIDEAGCAHHFGLGLPRLAADFSIRVYAPSNAEAARQFPFNFFVPPASRSSFEGYHFGANLAEPAKFGALSNAAKAAGVVMRHCVLHSCPTTVIFIKADLGAVQEMHLHPNLIDDNKVPFLRRTIIYVHVMDDGDDGVERNVYIRTVLQLLPTSRDGKKFYYVTDKNKLHSARHVWMHPKNTDDLAILRSWLTQDNCETLEETGANLLRDLRDGIPSDDWLRERIDPEYPPGLAIVSYSPRSRSGEKIEPASPSHDREHVVKPKMKLTVGHDDVLILTFACAGVSDASVKLLTDEKEVTETSEYFYINLIDSDRSDQLRLRINVNLEIDRDKDDESTPPPVNISDFHVINRDLKVPTSPMVVRRSGKYVKGKFTIRIQGLCRRPSSVPDATARRLSMED